MLRARLLSALTALMVSAAPLLAQLQYPETRRVDHVDEYHGVEVPDPYRWLENDVRTDAEVAAWVEAQNAVTFGYLEGIEARDAIAERLTELWDYERFGVPFERGGRFYFTRNNGLQAHSVLYTMDEADAEPRVLIDPNAWSDDGSAALSGQAFSDDGNYMAYGIQESGSDWRTWRVKDLRTGKDLDDELRWVKYSGTSWTADGNGFFYSRYDEPEEGTEYQGSSYDQKLYYHRVGTGQERDVLVYERPDHPEWGFGPVVTEDGRWLVISTWKGGHTNNVMLKDLHEPFGLPVELIGGWDARHAFVGNNGPLFYFQTNLDAPNGRLIVVDARHPQREHWRTVVPERDEALRGVSLVGNLFLCSYLKDAVSEVSVHNLRGEHVRDVELPGLGTASGFDGRRDDTDTFYSFTGYTTPPSIYRYDLITGESTLFRRSEVDFDPDDYTVTQVFYESKDGTRVPMFIAHRKGLELDGDNPTLLYGYGGFNLVSTPRFSPSRLAWMEMGGVFASANLRGGGEYGEAWHLAGTKAKKQNVFDDFIAAAEWLIEHDYTRPEKLAIQGRSNGGLLVGAVMVQRPELFGAALPAVGVMDMLRYHEFTAGRFWTGDYGSSDDPEEFKALYAYSPYHNLRPDTEYPPTLVTTADTDDRVVPGHSFKFAAALQAAHVGNHPVLIRIDTKAGHGSGKPTEQKIAEVADEWAFLVEALGMEFPPPDAEP